MNRKRLFGLLGTAAACICLAACGGEIEIGGGSSSGGSDNPPSASETSDSSQAAAVYSIDGAKDVVLKRGEGGGYDFSAGVTGTKDGVPEEVEVDFSAVKFETAGSYDVVYTCGDKEESVKAYVVDYAMDAFASNGYLIGSEVALPRAELAADSLKDSVTVAYAVDGTAVTDAALRFAEAGEHTYAVSFSCASGSALTEEYSFKILAPEDYYAQNWVGAEYVSLWESKNGEAAVYDADKKTIELKHNAPENNTRAFVFSKELYQAAFAAGMTEMTLKFSSEADAEYYIDSWEDEEENYYASPWGPQPWNMSAPYAHNTCTAALTELTLDLDCMSRTGSLLFLIAQAGKTVSFSEISFAAVNHTVAYSGTYENANKVSVSFDVAKDVSLSAIELYFGSSSTQAGLARRSESALIMSAGSISLNYADGRRKFNITSSLTGAAIPSGETDGTNAGVLPLDKESYTEYFNADGSRTYTVVFCRDYYNSDNAVAELYLGGHLLFTCAAVSPVPFKDGGMVCVMFNGSVESASGVGNFGVTAETAKYYKGEGIADVELGLDVAEYDYLEGRRLLCNGEEVELIADASKVVYGTAGMYEVAYKSEDGLFEQTVKAYIIPAYRTINNSTGAETDTLTLNTIVGKAVVLLRAEVDADEEAYSVEYKIDGESVGEDGLSPVYDEPGNHTFSIEITFFGKFTVTKNYKFYIVSSFGPYTPDNKFTLEFTASNNADLTRVELLIGTSNRTVANARKGAGLVFNDSLLTFVSNSKNGEFKVTKNDAVFMGGDIANQTFAEGAWLNSPFKRLYTGLYGGEEAASRGYKAIFYKTADGMVGIEFYIGNTETGAYTFFLSAESTVYAWPTGNLYVNLVVDGQIKLDAAVSDVRVEAESTVVEQHSYTIEFTVANSVDITQAEFFVGSKATTVEEARKGAGFVFGGSSLTFPKAYNPNGSVEEQLAARGAFRITKNDDVFMGGDIATGTFDAAKNNETWVNNPFGTLYSALFGGESAESRNYKLVVSTTEAGKIKIELYIGNTETGEYTFMFSIESLAYDWPKGDDVCVNIVLNGSVDIGSLVKNLTVTGS